MLPMLLLAVVAADFQHHTIATGLRGGYQVVAADLSGDGRPDLIALASGMREIVWFENPTWERHVLATVNRPINLDVWGKTIVLVEEFAMTVAASAGIVSVLEPEEDVRKPWRKREIDRIPTAHRVRWMDPGGDGRRIAVMAPLIGAKSVAPDYVDNVPVVFYRPDVWKRETISDSGKGVLHGLSVRRREGRDELLTAGDSGIHSYRSEKGKWLRSEISAHRASDVVEVRDRRERFIAAIEPWHGNQVVFHRSGGRQVIDETIRDGHGVYAADLDGDGRDEVIVAARGSGVRIYSAAGERQVLDETIASASCALADLNGDKRIDIACIGQASANLKWYENMKSR